jgi:hypothetical protein
MKPPLFSSRTSPLSLKARRPSISASAIVSLEMPPIT